jgi:hypothetical protein
MPATRDAPLEIDRDTLLLLARNFGVAVSASATQREVLNALLAPQGAVGGGEVRDSFLNARASADTNLAVAAISAPESPVPPPAADPAPSAELSRNFPVPFDVGVATTPIASVQLPTRMLNWANRNGITTLEEIAKRAPHDLLAERNLGRRSIRETRVVIEDLLQQPWEQLAGSAAPSPPVPPKHPWDELRLALPDALRFMQLGEFRVAARMRSYAAREQLQTLGDLAKRSSAELYSAKHVGRGSVRQLVEAIRDHSPREQAILARSADGLLEGWRTLLHAMISSQRTVLVLRAGLDGPAMLAQDIVSVVRLPHKTVYRREHAALADLAREQAWLHDVRTRVDAAVLVDGAVPLATLATDPWWAGIVARPQALDYFGRWLLDGKVRVVELDGIQYLARCTQAEVEEAWRVVRRAATNISLPASLAAFKSQVDPLADTVRGVLADALWLRLRALLHIDESMSGEPRVVGFGGSYGVEILANLRASPTPILVDVLEARLGRGPLPDEVLVFGHRLVGLEHHFPDFAAWMKRLVPAAARAMKAKAPKRQWSAGELMTELRRTSELPEWLTEWHLGSLLRRSGQVRSLGRLRFALKSASEHQEPVFALHELVRILRERGTPILRDQLTSELRKKTSFNEQTVRIYLAHAPFVQCDPELIGLLDRDLPGGAAALTEAADHIAALLRRRRRGLSAIQLHAEVTRISSTHALWSKQMCRSAVTNDGRFRLSKAGTIGLSTWATVRVPTRGEIIRRCLDASGGRVRLATVQQQIEAIHGGAWAGRGSIGSAAYNVGARMRGEWIELPAQTG